jgi:threonine synthase
MSYVENLKCLVCGREYKPGEVRYSCPCCGQDGILEVNYNYDGIKKVFSKVYLKQNNNFSMWRYLPLLPIDNDSFIGPLHVGGTPLYEAKRIREYLEVDSLWIKDDGRNPTASLKDRASAIAVVKAQELELNTLTCASTGNAASSLAGASASLGLKNYIFVPKTAPKAKIAQLLVFGATVFAVNGTYDEAFDLSIEATENFGWYNRNTAYNPYMVEGKKTVSLEIAEQLNFDVPDYIFVPVGDGCIISGANKGFYDLFNLGFIDKMPKLVAVQAEGCKPVVNAINGDGIIRHVEPNTIADSISVGIPRNGLMAVRDVKNSGGFGIAVSDDEILQSIKFLGSIQGIFAEPAGATGFAGYLKALKQEIISKKSNVVVIITGNGLKDIESALKAVSLPLQIEPNIVSVKDILEKIE